MKIEEVATVERAVAKKLYKNGTSYIALSATGDTVNFLPYGGEVGNRYAVLEPKDGVDGYYLNAVIEMSFPEFHKKSRTGINFQFETLLTFCVRYHESEQARNYIVGLNEVVKSAESNLLKLIDKEKDAKKYYLDGMFPKG